MKAFRFVAWGRPPEFAEVPIPEPGPGQVLVKVTAAGVCHSDLHIFDWPAGMLPWKLPFTLGHEVVGKVEALGPGVKAPEIGTAVAVYGPWGCGTCRACRMGMENYCERSAEMPGAGVGLGFDGGMAEYVLVPSPRLLIPIGDMDPIQAAPMTDAALTPYHAIKAGLPLLVPGSTAVVIGVGGLGHMAVQILDAISPATVIAVDKDQRKLDLAKRVGAAQMVPAGEKAADAIRKFVGPVGANAVFDFVGSDETIALAAKVVRPAGRVFVVGIAGGSFAFSFFSIPYEAAISSTYWGSSVELQEVLALAAGGKVKAAVETFALDDVATAYSRLRAGDIEGRAVILPASSKVPVGAGFEKARAN
ncbi:MAG TPA: NAD(P)-dependent alcohol dehydrogenase [Candidatus Dormibacteraeota bacterium]